MSKYLAAPDRAVDRGIPRVTPSYSELYQTDEALRAFVDSRIVQAGIDVQAAKVEHERDLDVIQSLQRTVEQQQQEIQGLKFKAEGGRRKSAR